MCPENKNNGKYIATESFESKKVIASGKDIVEVYNDAKRKGVEEPVISYVPKKGTICIY
jgi:hypothetical protein